MGFCTAHVSVGHSGSGNDRSMVLLYPDRVVIAVESVNSSIRRVTRNVKRWRGRDMRRRWAGLAIAEAAKHFHRIKGHRDLPVLIRALRQQSAALDAKQEAA